jgi:hypothetical protein
MMNVPHLRHAKTELVSILVDTTIHALQQLSAQSIATEQLASVHQDSLGTLTVNVCQVSSESLRAKAKSF